MHLTLFGWLSQLWTASFSIIRREGPESHGDGENSANNPRKNLRTWWNSTRPNMFPFFSFFFFQISDPVIIRWLRPCSSCPWIIAWFFSNHVRFSSGWLQLLQVSPNYKFNYFRAGNYVTLRTHMSCHIQLFTLVLSISRFFQYPANQILNEFRMMYLDSICWLS